MRGSSMPPAAVVPIGAAALSALAARAAMRNAARSSPARPRQSANCSAIWREGRRTPASIFLMVSTAEENLSPEQRQTLDELVREQADTIVEQIVVFRQHLRAMFNESETFARG